LEATFSDTATRPIRRFFFDTRKFRRDNVFVQKQNMARPEFKPTAAQRKQVAIAAAGGMAHDDIALALGIARGTLLKHFDAELSVGAAEKRIQVLGAMFTAAIKGNVAAQKAFTSLTPTIGTPKVEESDKPAKQPKLGKKEQAAADAVGAQAGTDWAELLERAPLQ
jgi:hypothetical protein